MKLPPVMKPASPVGPGVTVKCPNRVNWALVIGSLRAAPADRVPEPIPPPSGRNNGTTPLEPLEPLELLDALELGPPELLDRPAPLEAEEPEADDPCEPLDPLEVEAGEPVVDPVPPAVDPLEVAEPLLTPDSLEVLPEVAEWDIPDAEDATPTLVEAPPVPVAPGLDRPPLLAADPGT
jgi:hypothetical protein